jgi:hypothetical protein
VTDTPYSELRDRIRSLLLIADPDREWYCRVHAGENGAVDEVHVFCKIDGLILGQCLDLPQADRHRDRHRRWVEGMAARMVQRSLVLAARMN